VPDLPSGRVTLVFTDVEGSTRLLRELGPDYARVLDEHRLLLRSAFTRHGGVEVDTQGDSFFVAFPGARSAAAAALDAHTALASGPIRVRIGMHTGEPARTADRYVGLDVHLAARIGAAGHGGQTLLSLATERELDGDFPIRDLGEHRVKDFDEPVQLFQLGDAEFPLLKTISNTNLPRPASSFVGREEDVAALVDRVLGGARLVTLTGPGGSGKTRLALEAAAELVPSFRAGVVWVGLAALHDSAAVMETVARTLGARDDVVSHIGEREILLLLDNFERLLPAAAEVSAVVERCPSLHVLVTSRELLRLRDEVQVRVPPLAPPDAVRLFAERSGLEPDAAVERLCAALDDLPLAVELAAARTAVLSPGQILDRLGGRLDLFRGARDLDHRQQTLRATIDWSYELLDERERLLFARLGVFAGGCTLEAAEQVARADLDTLEALVHKSLVRHSGERFWMLETIREYAIERLETDPDAAALRRRHAEWFLAFAEAAEPRLEAADQNVWFDRLEADYANIREAIRPDDVAARFIAALRFFWVKRGYIAEGRRVCEELLPAVAHDDPARPMALATASLLAVMQGDWRVALARGDECRAAARERGEERPAIEVASALGRALLAIGEEERALALFDEAARRGAAVGRPPLTAIGLLNLGYVSLVRRDLRTAHEQLQKAVDAATSCGDPHSLARSLSGLASVALEDGRLDDAQAFAGQSLELSGPAADRDNACWSLDLIGAALAGVDPARAARLIGAADVLRESLGESLQGLELAQHERALGLLSPAFDEAYEAGRRLPFEEAVALALDRDQPTISAPGPTRPA
jgi:predicted ATPase